MENRGADLGWELSTAVVLFHEAVARRLGLGAAEHKALGVVSREGPLSAGELADRLGLGRSAVTGIVDRLEQAGYALREADPADRRRVLIRANPDRQPNLGAIFTELGREMGAVTAAYDDRERAVIADYVTNTIAVLRAQTERLSRRTP